jgi:hypothetical protein
MCRLGSVFAMQGRHYQGAYDFIAGVSTGSILSLIWAAKATAVPFSRSTPSGTLCGTAPGGGTYDDQTVYSFSP